MALPYRQALAIIRERCDALTEHVSDTSLLPSTRASMRGRLIFYRALAERIRQRRARRGARRHQP